MQLEQAQQVAEEALGVGELVGWIALVIAVSAFVGWGVTEMLNRKLFAPLKAEWKAEGKRIRPWKWTALLGGISTLLGVVSGLVLGSYTPIDSFAVGSLVGLGSGASPAWIVKLVQRRAKQAVGDERGE